jgi:hypothetical protein
MYTCRKVRILHSFVGIIHFFSIKFSSAMGKPQTFWKNNCHAKLGNSSRVELKNLIPVLVRFEPENICRIIESGKKDSF